MFCEPLGIDTVPGRGGEKRGKKRSGEEEMRERKGEERRTMRVAGAVGIKCALWCLVFKSIEVSSMPTPGQAVTVSKARA